jgi:hypothetical protein
VDASEEEGIIFRTAGHQMETRPADVEADMAND